MFGWRVSTLSTIGFLILLGLASVAAFKVGRHGNIVGDVRTVGVVLDPKWKRVALNMKLQGSLIDSGAYQCTLQVCEHDAIAGVGLRRAAGLFKSPNADSADQDGLTRDMAFEILVETMPQFRKAFDETLTRIKIGPLTGYRTVVSPDLNARDGHGSAASRRSIDHRLRGDEGRWGRASRVPAARGRKRHPAKRSADCPLIRKNLRVKRQATGE